MGKVSRIFARFLALIFVMALLALPLFGASVVLVAAVWIAVSVLTLYGLSSRRNRRATQSNAAQVFRQQLGGPQSSKSAVRNHGSCSPAAASNRFMGMRASRSKSSNQQLRNRMSVRSNLMHARATLASRVQDLLLGHRPRDQSYGFQAHRFCNHIGHYREPTGLCPG